MAFVKNITSAIPYDELAEVLREAFKERLVAGLNFACASFSGEDLKNHLSENAIVFGAYDEKLIGLVVLNSIRRKFGFAFGTHEYLAVLSSAQGKGVGSLMFKELKSESFFKNLDFILSDTALGADSSIYYHKKNGFKPYACSHYPDRTYKSINFILPLTWKGKLLSSWLGRKILGRIFKHT